MTIHEVQHDLATLERIAIVAEVKRARYENRIIERSATVQRRRIRRTIERMGFRP